MLIQVTQEDIDKGKPFDATHCPVANAIKRCRPDLGLIKITRFTILDKNNKRLSYHNKDLYNFIANYDHYNKVIPSEFEIELFDV